MASPKNDYPSFLPGLWSDEIIKTMKANSLLKSLMVKGRVTPSKVNGELNPHDEFVRDAALVKKYYNEQGIPESEQVIPLTSRQRNDYRASIGERIFGMRITARDDETTE